MIELLFVVWLDASPTTCERRAMQFVDVSPMACAMGAQPLLAQWAEEHPGWQVRRWTCQPGNVRRDT